MSKHLFNKALAVINALNATTLATDQIVLSVLKNRTYKTPATLTLTLSWLPNGAELDSFKESVIDIVGTHDITWTPDPSGYGSLHFEFSL